MPDRDTLLSMAEECEKATGPDRELDVLIAQAVGFSVGDLTVDKLLSYSPHNTIAEIAKWCSGDPTPFFVWRYTASLDAAMSLVPEGWGCDIKLPAMAVAPLANMPSGAIVHKHPDVEVSAAATPALALCAAALRSRAAQITREQG